jgi:hypothetical protein
MFFLFIEFFWKHYGKHLLSCKSRQGFFKELETVLFLRELQYSFQFFNGEANPLEYPQCKTIEELRQCVIEGNKEYGLTMQVLVDGQEIKLVKENYKVESPPFNFPLPANHVLGGSYEGTTTAYSIGWYLMLEPLPEGKHEVVS